jgi:hypothetical protein
MDLTDPFFSQTRTDKSYYSFGNSFRAIQLNKHSITIPKEGQMNWMGSNLLEGNTLRVLLYKSMICPLPFLSLIKREDDKGGPRKMERIKQWMLLTLVTLLLIFLPILGHGQEKAELPKGKGTSPKSLMEKAKQKAKEEIKEVKKDTKEAGKELKKSATALPDKAGKEFKKTGKALKETGKGLKERLKETWDDLKKLFKKK